MFQKIFIVFCLFPLIAAAEFPASSLREIQGVKFPNSAEEGSEPVVVSALALRPGASPHGFTELLPFLLRAPDQEDAGSCLYMSLTGIAEWWLAKLHPDMPRTPDGPLDLSERYLMNVAGEDEDSNGIANWKTDSIYLFNKAGGTLRNADYRFTKGWYTSDTEGRYHVAREGEAGAEYGTPYNWIDLRSEVAKLPLVRLPAFSREILFADPESNQWNTGVMPDDIAERIKTALREKKAPVQVIYNHFGYWHSTVIVGYDDDLPNNNCSFVTSFLAYMPRHAADLRRQAGEEKDPAEREKLLRSAARSEKALTQARAAFARTGCHPGAFYVRDSIYGDPDGPVYDYDPSGKGKKAPYVKATVLHEYDWVRVMASHANQILVQ